MEIDWENSNDVWKEYAAKKLAEECDRARGHRSDRFLLPQ